MDIGRIFTVIVLLTITPILLAVGSITVFETTGALDTTSDRTAYTENTTNMLMDDNTTNIPDGWDNAVTDNSTAAYGDCPNDNQTLKDNSDNGTCEWYQDFDLTSIRGGVTSATLVAKWRLTDNTGRLENLEVKVWLDDGTDNNTIYFIDNANSSKASDNDTWFTVDNDVTAYITHGGTYYVRLYDNIGKIDNNLTISVEWDNVKLTVNTYDAGYLENAIINVESNTSTGYNLGSLMPLIIAAVALISIIVLGFMGLSKGTTRRF